MSGSFGIADAINSAYKVMGIVDQPSGVFGQMNLPKVVREFKPDIDIWLPAIRSALSSIGCSEEYKSLMVWEKITGQMTVIEMEKMIKEVAGL